MRNWPIRPLAAWAIAFLILLARRPETLALPQFVNEDGLLFVGALTHTLVWAPFAGYILLVPRVVMAAATIVPIALAPLATNLTALVIQAGVAAYIAGDALCGVVPDRRVRLAIAGLFILVPGADETVGHIYNVQWNLGVFLIAASLATRIGALGRIALAASVLTGPLGLLLAPLYWWRAQRTRDWQAALIVTAGAALQLAVLLSSPRVGADTLRSVDLATRVLGVRAILEPIIGARFLEIGVAIGTPVVIAAALIMVAVPLFVLASRRVPRLALLTLLYAGGVTMVAGILFARDAPADVFRPWVAERYFLLWTLAVELMVLIAAIRGSMAARILAAVTVFAIVGDFALIAPPNLHWAEASLCLGGATECIVPIPWAFEIPWSGK